MFSSMIPRLLIKAPCAIPLRQQTHRFQNGMTSTYRFQQTQRYHSPRRQKCDDKKRKQQSSGWSDRFDSHFRRHEMTYTYIGLGSTIFVAVMKAVYGPEPPKPEHPPWVMSDMATLSLINPIPGFW